MTVVIRLSVVVTDKLQRIAFCNVFRMFQYELFGCFPQGRDGFLILVQAESETIFLVVLFHENEWVEVDIAEQFDGWFDTPVHLVVGEELVFEEKAGFEATHVTIRD